MRHSPTSAAGAGPSADGTGAAEARHTGGEWTAQPVEARFRWARRQGHIAYLWPEVPIDAWRAGLGEIERAARFVIAGARVRIEPPPGVGPQALGIAAFTSGMGPLLGYWLETGRLAADSPVAGLLSEHLDHGRRRAVRMASALQDALDLIRGAGADAIVIKSAHTSRTVFPEPGTRPAADIDLIVDPHAVADISRAFERAGYVQLKRQRRPRKIDWRPPGSPETLRSIELTHADNPFSIEIHDSADREFFGVRTVRLGPIGPDQTRQAPEIHPAARTLRQPLLTAYLAAHASEELHQLQLIRIVELLAVTRDDADGRLDWSGLHSLLRERNALRFVYPAFELTERLAPGAVDAGFHSALAGAATRRMRRVVERIGPGTAQRLEGLSLDERFLWADGPLEMLRRMVHMVWPTRGQDTRLLHVYGRRVTRLLRGRVRLRRP